MKFRLGGGSHLPPPNLFSSACRIAGTKLGDGSSGPLVVAVGCQPCTADRAGSPAQAGGLAPASLRWRRSGSSVAPVETIEPRGAAATSSSGVNPVTAGAVTGVPYRWWRGSVAGEVPALRPDTCQLLTAKHVVRAACSQARTQQSATPVLCSYAVHGPMWKAPRIPFLPLSAARPGKYLIVPRTSRYRTRSFRCPGLSVMVKPVCLPEP